MLDMIIREAAAKFGLGDKAGMVVSALLGMMFQKQSGGLAGFLDMFKQKDLGNLAASWIGGGGMPLGINPTQLENVIGGGLMNDLASKTGLPIGPIGSALAFMLPNIVRILTADGKVPTDVPAAVTQYMSGDKAAPGAAAAAGAAAIGAAAASVGAAGKAAVGNAAETAVAATGGGLSKWLWLIPVVLVLGWFMMRKSAEAPAPAAPAPKPAPAAEAPKVEAPKMEAPKVAEPTPAAAVAEAPKDDAARNAAAAAKMDALKAAGNVSGDELVKALNLAIIHFASGSAQISPDSMDIVKKAAETIKAGAAGTKLEVGGHTDSSGNPASNMKLSEARAQSVMAALVGFGVNKGMLSAKGYGDSKPVGSNDTAEGKAKNRRMEFSLVK
ncbi:MAG: OmpA family protein [Burkholderiales bacterium]